MGPWQRSGGKPNLYLPNGDLGSNNGIGVLHHSVWPIADFQEYPGSISHFACKDKHYLHLQLIYAAIYIQGDNWIVRGFEVTGGYGGGISLFGNNIEVVDNYVHDVQGFNNYNIAGIFLAETYNNALIHHNIVNNTFDPALTSASSDRGNVYNINMYTGQGNIIEHNAVGYNHAPNTTPYAVQGGGIRNKHGLFLDSVVTENQFRYNVVYNTENQALDVDSAGTWVNGNLSVGSSHCFQIHDDHAIGGSYSLYDIQYKNNTCVPGVHVLGGNVNGGAIGLSDTPGEVRTHGVIFTGNVIDDSATTS